MMNPDDQQITVPQFAAMKAAGRKITMLTAYDYAMAGLVDAAGVEGILVGDSLSMVVQGHSTTLPVTLEEMIYHAEMVGRAVRHALVVVDMPFPSFHLGTYKAIEKRGPHSQGDPLPCRQARRRRGAGRGDLGIGFGGHSGDGPLRTAPAERPPAGRLSGAARRAATAGRRPGGRAFRRVRRGVGVHSGGNRPRASRPRSRFPRSASAPAPAATVKFSSSTIS